MQYAFAFLSSRCDSDGFSADAEQLKKKMLMDSQSVPNSSKALQGVHGVHVDPRTGCPSVGSAHGFLMQQLWQESPGTVRHIHGCIDGDQSVAETIVNVVTSLPFIALGINAPRKNQNCRLYANSLIGVGVASSLYHSSRGRLRKYLRWFDYSMIAATTVCLSRALRKENPKLLMAASALCLPFQPLMVSVVHTGMMEVAFAKRAIEDPNLRGAHRVHKLSSLAGGALFIAEDVFPATPFIHAAWHLAAAVGVGTCNKLLE